MAFDPVTFSAVNNLRPPIGSLIQVAAVADPRLVATGEIIDAADYPALADALPASSQANFYDEVPYGIANGAIFSQPVEMGMPVKAIVQGNDVFIICVQQTTYVNARGFAINIFKSVAGKDFSAGLVFVNTVELPWHATASHCSVIGDTMYIASASSAVRKYDLTDLTFQTFTTLNLTLAGAGFAEGGGTLVAYTLGGTGTAGVIRASTDGGATWTNATTFTTTGTINRIVYGNGTFVLVTSGTTTGNMANSTNGLTWTPRLVGSVGHIAINFVNGYFIASPLAAGAYYTSTDGITFAANAATVAGLVTTAALSDGTTFISGGYYPGSTAGLGVVSTVLLKGATPVGATALAKPYANSVGVLTVDNTVLLFTSYSSGGQTFFSYSNNAGATWLGTAVMEVPGEPQKYLLPAISADKRVIVALESSALRNGAAMAAATVHGVAIVDGVRNQFTLTTSLAAQWRGVLVNPNKPRGFYAWGTGGTALNMVFASSDDGVNWTVLTSTLSGYTFPTMFPMGVAIGNDGSIAVCTSAVTSIGVSVDGGRTFTGKTIGSSGVSACGAFLNRVIFMSTTGAYIWTDWTTYQSSSSWTSSPAPTAFCADATRAVFTVANRNTYYYSFDGMSWTKATLPATILGGNPAFVGEWLMIPTGNGAMYRTKDFATWELLTIGENSKYVIDQVGDLIESTDSTLTLAANTTKKVPYFLKQNTSSQRKRIPKRTSDNGMIWAVVAK